MMKTIELQSTRCASCNTEGNADELYPANFDLQALNPTIFSARRLPDRIHYRMVKCKTCGLVRSDPIVESEVLTNLYAQSAFDYIDEVTNLKCTYGHYLAKLNKYGGKKSALLEIGCGNGFFMEVALRHGYNNVRGVEPSVAAVAKASPEVRPHIIRDIMRPGLFEPEVFDVICLFQVLDHIPNPDMVINECFRLMKAGGLILYINHNIEALSSILLKSRSPIIDIEHLYLYSPATIDSFFSAHNFQVKDVGSVSNRYTLFYLVRLMPFPLLLKRFILTILKNNPIGRLNLSFPLGNLYLIAQKPNNNHTFNHMEESR